MEEGFKMDGVSEDDWNKKSKTEQSLLLLQDVYLKTGCEEAYKELFTILFSYARSLTLKKARGKIFLPPDLVNNVTLEACTKFMQQYDKPDFKIDTSFAGLLNLKILESLYGPKIQQNDKIASLSAHIDVAHKKEIELGDMPETLKFKYLFRPEHHKNITVDPYSELLYKQSTITSAIMSVHDLIYKDEILRDYLYLSIGILQFFRKKRKYEKYRDTFLSDDLKVKLDRYLELMKQRLMEFVE